MTDESENKHDTKHNKKQTFAEKYNLYILFTVAIVALIGGLLLANAMQKGTLDQITTENRNTIESLQQEKDQLREEKESLESEKSQAESQLQKLQGSVSADRQDLMEDIADAELATQQLEDLITSLANEAPQTRREIKEYYEIEWRRFILEEPGEFTSVVTIENTGISERTFDLEVQLMNKYNKAFSSSPADGSLTLGPGGSGNINLRFDALDEGYGVFSLHVNGHYAGDIVAIVME